MKAMWKVTCVVAIVQLAAMLVATVPVQAQANMAAVNKESTANTQTIPKQILKTGVSLTTRDVSANSLQLANTIGLTDLLLRLQNLRGRADAAGNGTLESLLAKQELLDARQDVSELIQKTNLEVDFAISAIEAEHQVYEEILSAFTSDRDKAVAKTNAISFISNGALWAVSAALAIPGYQNSLYAIPSGIVGIPAGVVPSFASMWTLKQFSGKKKRSEVEPNMLAKIFGYPTNPDIEYPKSVWAFLNQVPADDPLGKRRIDQLVDRWIADANMSGFTDRNSKKQLDAITASVSQKKGLTINTLTSRSIMLQQLHAEVWKMKRLLLELTMVSIGEKTFNQS